jgi:hypothetical protein
MRHKIYNTSEGEKRKSILRFMWPEAFKTSPVANGEIKQFDKIKLPETTTACMHITDQKSVLILHTAATEGMR